MNKDYGICKYVKMIVVSDIVQSWHRIQSASPGYVIKLEIVFKNSAYLYCCYCKQET